MAGKSKRIWVDLPEALERRLHAAARRGTLTRDEMLRAAIEEYLDRRMATQTLPEPPAARAVGQSGDPVQCRLSALSCGSW